MILYSTNHQSPDVSLEEAVFRGLPPDNGLYMPHVIPTLPDSFFENIDKMSITDIAFEVTLMLLWLKSKRIPTFWNYSTDLRWLSKTLEQDLWLR